MAPKKPSRQEYLNQRVALAESLGRDINIVIPKNPTKAQLTSLDDQINKILYPSVKYGDTTSQEELDRKAQEEEARRQAELERLRNQQAEQEQKAVSAKAVAKSLAQNLGINTTIVDKISDLIINQGYTADSVDVAMRDLPEFKERFAGIDKYNKNFAADIAAGRKAQALDPYTYIQLEKDYQEVLNRTGLGDLANQNTFSELIGNDVSVQEVKDRVNNVYDKINNADDMLKTQLKTYFPTLGSTDFAKALLTGKNPEDMANQLQRKYQRAEISSEAARFGLTTNQAMAQELETLGVTREMARQGFSTVAQNLQPLSKYAQIYEGTTAGLEEELAAEQFKGLESQRRKKLVQREIGTFSGESGISRTSLSTRGTAGNI